MHKSFDTYRIICFLLCMILAGAALCLCVQAETVREYTVTIDHPKSIVSHNTTAIISGYDNRNNDILIIEGWIKTDLTMSYYEYTKDGKTWITAPRAVKQRDDLKKICPDTYKTAGFRIEIDVSDLNSGKYSFFIRGYTKNGDVIDVLAMINTSIGDVDTDTFSYREINLLDKGAENGILSVQANQQISLGAHKLTSFEAAEIVLNTDSAKLTLLSADPNSPLHFSVDATEYVDNQDGTYTAKFDLKQISYAGEILLLTDSAMNIHSIHLMFVTPDYYTGDMEIHMTKTPYDNLSGANCVTASLHYDDTVGTYTKLKTTQNTNDPYMYFNLGNYLKNEQQIQISADHYRYAVITMQAPDTNSKGSFRLFLCAGSIRGPSGNSHIAFQPINDGQWHRYIIPLYEEDDWTGQIHGVRFDFIDNNSTNSDYANIACFALYPDLDSAQAAANQPFEIYNEDGNIPQDKYQETDRAPSGKADAITWFDQSLSPCFKGANKVSYSFDEYGHLIITAIENTNDPYITFDLQSYAEINDFDMLHTQDYQTVVLRILADEQIYGTSFSLYYYSGGMNYAQGNRSVHQNFEGGNWEYLIYDMSKAPDWTDDILGFRLDVATQINSGQSVYISDILFFADQQAWLDYATKNGILSEESTREEIESDTQNVETERSTIEIPTQGPGLEYIPSDDTSHSDHFSYNGCKGFANVGIMGILLLGAAMMIKRKRD